MNAKELREKIQSCLVRGEIEESLNLLIYGLDSQQQRRDHDNALMLKAKWEGIKQEQLRGIISRQEYELAISKIMAGIQTITNEVDHVSTATQKGQTRAGLTTKIIISAAIVLVLGLSGWYFTTNAAKQNPISTSTLAEKAAAQSPQQEKPAEVATNIKSTNPNTAVKETPSVKPGTAKVEAPPSAQKTVEPTIKSDPPAAKPTFLEVKVILTKSDVKLKINGESPDYVGTATGMVRTIRVAAGKYKFEVTENGVLCTSEQNISAATQKIFPTCK